MLICIIDNQPCTSECRYDNESADDCPIAYAKESE